VQENRGAEIREAEEEVGNLGLVIPCRKAGFRENTSLPNEGGDLHYIA
jgi:hypothetical protein